uniref:Uncharacterized protein n=1 Tax=Anguilla anguilla TaxID=7936 RepID=A0A0E9T2A9_ANGAN
MYVKHTYCMCAHIKLCLLVSLEPFVSYKDSHWSTVIYKTIRVP